MEFIAVRIHNAFLIQGHIFNSKTKIIGFLTQD